jgi:hypothetical protein
MEAPSPQSCGLAPFMAAFRKPAIFVLALLLQATWQAQCGELIAFYRFDRNGNDSLGQNSPFVLTNQGTFPAPAFMVTDMPITNGVLRLDGRYEPNGHQWNYLGTSPLKNFDYRSFAISIDFCPLPLSPRRTVKLEQRLDLWTHGLYSQWFGPHVDPNVLDTCNIITGGRYYRWIGFNRRDNTLHLTLNNGSFEHRFANVSVDPYHWHNLICSVDLRRQQVLVWFDARQLETVKLPDNFKLEVLGTSNEASDREFTFTDYSNGSVALGYAADFKIFRPGLSESEIVKLSASFPGACPTFTPRAPSSWPIVLTCLGVLAVIVFLALRARHGAAHRPKF